MEQIIVKPEPKQEDPQYVEAMVAKAEGREPEQPDTQQATGDQLLAGKYRTEDELRKGITELLQRKYGRSLEEIYKELESELGRQSAKKPDDQYQQTAPNPTNPVDLQIKEQQEQAASLLAKVGLNLEDFNREFITTGRLSEESYKKLMDAGFPRQMVDAYIAGLQALAEKKAQQLYTITGGQDNYQRMIEWAAVNLSEEERNWFNSMVATDQATFAVEALWARYVRENGNPPTSLLHGSRSNTASDVYESVAQVVQDINDPRYKTDPAFRRRVEEKLMRSNIL